jgi:hypothetical protein
VSLILPLPSLSIEKKPEVCIWKYPQMKSFLHSEIKDISRSKRDKTENANSQVERRSSEIDCGTPLLNDRLPQSELLVIKIQFEFK